MRRAPLKEWLTVVIALSAFLSAAAQSVDTITRVFGPKFIVYQHGRYHVVGSSYFYPTQRQPWNYWQVDVNSRPSTTQIPSDNASRFSSLAFTQAGSNDAFYVATPTRNLPSGFQQDWIYAVYNIYNPNNVDPDSQWSIAKISPDGSYAEKSWVRMGSSTLYTSLVFDEVGTFDNDLLILHNVQQNNTWQAGIWKVDAGGNMQQIATVGRFLNQNALVVPNDPQRYGPMAGKLINITDDIIAIDPNGSVQVLGSINRNVATLSLAVGNVVYLANWEEAAIQRLVIPALDNYRGDIIACIYDTRAPGSGIARIYWDADAQAVRWNMLLTFDDLGLVGVKGASAVVVPEPSSVLTLLGFASLWAACRRCSFRTPQTIRGGMER